MIIGTVPDGRGNDPESEQTEKQARGGILRRAAAFGLRLCFVGRKFRDASISAYKKKTSCNFTSAVLYCPCRVRQGRFFAALRVPARQGERRAPFARHARLFTKNALRFSGGCAILNLLHKLNFSVQWVRIGIFVSLFPIAWKVCVAAIGDMNCRACLRLRARFLFLWGFLRCVRLLCKNTGRRKE